MDWTETEATPEWSYSYPRGRREPRLSIEFIPKGAYGINLRSHLTKEQWDRVRRHVYAKAGQRCQICGGRGEEHPVECHEVWKWDYNNRRQILVGCAALCPACHQVKHMGRTTKIGKFEAALTHLKKVNKWSYSKAEIYVYECIDRHVPLVHIPSWELDIKWAHNLLKEIDDAKS